MKCPEMPEVTVVIGSNCISCGKCRKVCKTGAIASGLDNKYYILTERCTGCGNCKEICPVGAIVVMDD